MGARKAKNPAKKPRNLVRRTRTAYHEAGHAVLSAAINDAPRLVSIKGNGESLGRTQQSMFARPEVLVQVHLAGLAAEHLLTGRRSQHLNAELGFAILSLITPNLSTLASAMRLEGRDEYQAVQVIVAMGCVMEVDSIRDEVERFYEASRASLEAVWPVVRSVAKALLKHEELDSDDLFEAMGESDIYMPVLAVQELHGLHPRK